MKVVILAGGFGTRLSELTQELPKPMVRIMILNFSTYHENLRKFWF